MTQEIEEPRVCPECQFEQSKHGTHEYTPHSKLCSRREKGMTQEIDWKENIGQKFTDSFGAVTVLGRSRNKEIVEWFLSEIKPLLTHKYAQGILDGRAEESIGCADHCKKEVSLEREKLIKIAEGKIQKIYSKPKDDKEVGLNIINTAYNQALTEIIAEVRKNK